MYKELIRQKTRFSTTRGVLTLEQLWELPIEELDKLALELEKQYNESSKKSFVVKKSTKDKTLKMKFDVVLDVLTTLVEERDAAQEKEENKKHNEKILALMAEKQEDALKTKSLKELEAMLR